MSDACCSPPKLEENVRLLPNRMEMSIMFKGNENELVRGLEEKDIQSRCGGKETTGAFDWGKP